jgi:hypothetical protein
MATLVGCRDLHKPEDQVLGFWRCSRPPGRPSEVGVESSLVVDDEIMMTRSSPINPYAQTTLFELVILSNLIAFAPPVNQISSFCGPV